MTSISVVRFVVMPNLCAFNVVFNTKGWTGFCMLLVSFLACDYTVYIVKCELHLSVLWHCYFDILLQQSLGILKRHKTELNGPYDVCS